MKSKKKKVLSLAISACLLLQCIPPALPPAAAAEVEFEIPTVTPNGVVKNVATETELRNALGAAADGDTIKLTANITLASLTGISVANKSFILDLNLKSLAAKSGVSGTDGADGAKGANGSPGTAGTSGGYLFQFSNVTAVIKNGVISGGNGGDGGYKSSGGGGVYYYGSLGLGADAGNGGDCIRVTAKSSITFNSVTASGGSGGITGCDGVGGLSYGGVYAEGGKPHNSGTSGSVITGAADVGVDGGNYSSGPSSGLSISYPSGEYQVSGYYYGTGAATFDLSAGSNISVNNATLVAGYGKGNDSSAVSTSSAKVRLTNCTISTKSGAAVRVLGQNNSVLISNCTLSSYTQPSSTEGNGAAVYVQNGNLAIKDSTLKGSKGNYWRENSIYTYSPLVAALYVRACNAEIVNSQITGMYGANAIDTDSPYPIVRSGTLKGGSKSANPTADPGGTGSYTLGDKSIITNLVVQSSTVAGSVTIEEAKDEVPPTATISKSTLRWTRSLTLTITALDDQKLHDTPYSWDNGQTWTAVVSKDFEQNQTVHIMVRDAMENKQSYSVEITNIDRVAPSYMVSMGAKYKDTGKVPVTIQATDNNADSALYYSFDGGATWDSVNTCDLEEFSNAGIAVKDEAGNIATGTIMVLQGYGETQMGTSKIITAVSAIDNVIYGKSSYIASDDIVRNYDDSEYGKAGIAVKISALRTAQGYLKGYALLNNSRYPIRWGSFEGAEVTGEDSDGFVYINSGQFAASGRNLKLQIVVEEYKEAACTTRINGGEKNIPVSVDVSGPMLNVSYNQFTSTATIVARDSISGVTSVIYRVSTDGGSSFGEWKTYSAPFTATGNLVFEVMGEDRLENISTYSSTGLTNTADADLQDTEINVYTSVSRSMTTYLIGGNKTNSEKCPTPF